MRPFWVALGDHRQRFNHQSMLAGKQGQLCPNRPGDPIGQGPLSFTTADHASSPCRCLAPPPSSPAPGRIVFPRQDERRLNPGASRSETLAARATADLPESVPLRCSRSRAFLRPCSLVRLEGRVVPSRVGARIGAVRVHVSLLPGRVRVVHLKPAVRLATPGIYAPRTLLRCWRLAL